MFPIVEADSPALEGTSLPAFVVARDGLYLRKRSMLGLSQTKVDRVAHLPRGKAFLDYRLPKLPTELMGQVVGFFRAVYRRQQTEAIVLLLWQDDHFELLVPSQSTTSVSVRHKLDPSSLPAGSRLVGTIHSHGAFSAFASATDEDDEADLDGLHVVVGDLLRRKPSFSAALVVDGHRFGVRQSQVLERPRSDRAAARRVAGASQGGSDATAQAVEEVRASQAAARQGRASSHVARSATAGRTPRRRGKPCREARLPAPHRSRADIRHDRRSGRCLVASSWLVVAASAHSCWRHWFGI